MSKQNKSFQSCVSGAFKDVWESQGKCRCLYKGSLGFLRSIQINYMLALCWDWASFVIATLEIFILYMFSRPSHGEAQQCYIEKIYNIYICLLLKSYINCPKQMVSLKYSIFLLYWYHCQISLCLKEEVQANTVSPITSLVHIQTSLCLPPLGVWEPFSPLYFHSYIFSLPAPDQSGCRDLVWWSPSDQLQDTEKWGLEFIG